jgi:hypothetical protein
MMGNSNNTVALSSATICVGGDAVPAEIVTEQRASYRSKGHQRTFGSKR